MELQIGDVTQFAIESGNYDATKQKGKIRFWINNKHFGDFKKSNDFNPVTDALKSIIESGNTLYDVSFEGKTAEEIFSTVLVLNTETEDFTDEEYAQMERYERFGFYWGEQFNNITAVTYIKDNYCHFLWSQNSNLSTAKINYLKNLQTEIVRTDIFFTVAKDFLNTINGQ